MKSRLLFLLVFLMPIFSKAQVTGEAIKFDYDNAGQRIKRYQDLNAILNKPGRNGEQPADTVIGYYKKEDPLAKITESDYFVKAYPNPVKDVLYIENLSWKEGDVAEYKLMDATGKEILSKRTTQAKDNMQFSSGITPGSYHVRYYVNNTFIISWQIVKL